MLFRLLLLFTIVPMVEFILLWNLAQRTSLLTAIAIVLVTGLIGASLARWQGFRTIRRIQEDLANAKIPADALLDGLLILIAGALLLTPGILTDAFGFALLLPPLRAILKKQIRSRMTVSTQFGSAGQGWTSQQWSRQSWSPRGEAGRGRGAGARATERFEHDEIIDVRVQGSAEDESSDATG